MPIKRKDGEATRKRIIAAACAVFSERGFHGASNAEICRRSKVNGAAINYHFRSKEALYVEAFKRALVESVEKHPFDGGSAPSDKPEVRLKAAIRSLISRICDPQNRSFPMLNAEMSKPTDLLDPVLRNFIEEEKLQMANIVAPLLGSDVSSRELELCASSVIGLCLHPAFGWRRDFDKSQSRKKAALPKRSLDIDDIAGHVLRFSLGALNSIAIENRERAGRAS